MTAATWPQVTCTACGATGPGRAKMRLCKRCYARAQHPVQACGGCGQTHRHLAAGLCARCYRLSLTRLAACPACGQERPIYFGDRCERCKRRAAARAGACAQCGKPVARLWSGCCRSCHARRYQTTGACRDCGDLTLLTSGLCKPCRLFRWKHPAEWCPYCGRQQPIGAAGGCRSCQAAQRATRALARARRKRRIYASTGACADCGDLARLISGLCSTCRQFRSSHPLGTCPYCGRQQPIGAAGGCRPCQAAQRTARGLTPARPKRPATPGLTAASWPLLEAITRYGSARGWAPSTQQCARRALAAVLTGELGPPPWDAGQLRRFLAGRHLVALRVVEFLTDEGLARTSPRAALGQWLERRLAALPAPFAAEVQVWTEALHGRGPRAGRPRHPRTIEAYLRVLQTPLAAWAASYGSLRQVTTEDLTAQLDTFTGATRRLAMAAMRSLFTTLKARRVLFTNPAAPLTGRALPPPPVLPLDDTRRARLLSDLDQPAERLIVLLAGVHALRPSQICALTLDAVGPGATTFLIGGRARPLDQLTLQHLRAWLDARRARWPATANPHLLINRSTAGGLQPADRSYVQATVRRAGITAAELRAARLLDEACASGGDPLALTHLFGISDPTAIRYCAETSSLNEVPGGHTDRRSPAPPPGPQEAPMRYPTPGDAELTGAIRQYVTPQQRYLKLLGGNFMSMNEAERTPFLQELAASARQVSDRELGTLLDSEWRARLTAAWLIGFDRREQFRTRIGELLLASELTYAGQGYCFALARFATTADAELLAAYLDTYLPQPGKRYDQHWALGALLHLDAQLNTGYAAPFLGEDGPWQRWNTTEKTPGELRQMIDQLCAIADEYMRPG